MTEERRAPRPQLELAPEEAHFVRRLADAYAPRPASPQERVAFRAELDRRIERGRSRPWLPALGGVAAAGLALALVLGQTGSAPAPAPGASLADTSPEEALLALATAGSDTLEGEEGDENLPDEYEAIASLFLGEV